MTTFLDLANGPRRASRPRRPAAPFSIAARLVAVTLAAPLTGSPVSAAQSEALRIPASTPRAGLLIGSLRSTVTLAPFQLFHIKFQWLGC